MELKVFLQKLLKKKKALLIFAIIGMVVFAVYGFKSRDNVNAGIEYCSESCIEFESDSTLSQVNDADLITDKTEAIVLSDAVIEGVKNGLQEKKILMSESEIRNSIIVKPSLDVVNITVHSANAENAKLICELFTQNAYMQLDKSVKNVNVLKNSTDVYTATISSVDSTTKQGERVSVVTPKSEVSITPIYTIKEMVKSGILGGIIFVILASFVFSIRFFFEEK